MTVRRSARLSALFPSGVEVFVADTRTPIPRVEGIESEDYPAERLVSALGGETQALADCHEAALLRNSQARGRLRVRLVIDKLGDIAIAENYGSDLGDYQTIQCALRALRRTRVPKPDLGIAKVTLPLVFELMAADGVGAGEPG